MYPVGTLLRFVYLLPLTGCLANDPTQSAGVVDRGVDPTTAISNDADADGWIAVDAGGADCNDGDPTIHPGVTEVWYDGVDSDCDGANDYDADLDGHSADTHGGLDCDDADPSVHPGAPDPRYDGVDSDCGGGSDYDADADGYDSTDFFGQDCDDGNAKVHPGASEDWYDGVDSDCDGADDYDADADGFDSARHSGLDCNDADPQVRPGATEVWYDGVDSDCDGADDYDADADGYSVGNDGYASAAYVAGDCDDTDAGINPGATEVWYDGVDTDCDGANDYDADADGHASADYYGDDCDDTSAEVHPGLEDTWYDGVDADCDGASDYDADGDGFDLDTYGGLDCDDADPHISPVAEDTWYDGVDTDCDGASDYDADADGYDADTYEGLDCDDADSAISPGATEVWYDGVDADCDGANDYDADADGYESQDHGGEDCYDDDDTTWPGAISSHEGITMAYICPGTFTMGSESDEVGRSNDETAHEVTLTGGYYLGVLEVTQSEFEDFMGYQPSASSEGCGDCPVENITWHEAAAFANAVSDAAGLERCFDCTGSEESTACELGEDYDSPYDCEGYRLPTEAEWERAARAGTTTAFSNGGNLYEGDTDGDGTDDHAECDGDLALDNGEILDDYGLYCGNRTSGTDETAIRLPSPWGLFDIHGNVREWVHDGWDEGDYREEAVTDPWGDASGAVRLYRGGSWYNGPGCLRSANRAAYDPEETHAYLGLRLARSE